MGSGASKKAKNEAESLEEDEEEDYDSFSKKRSQALNKGQPRLEQAGLLPKLESVQAHSSIKKRTSIIGLADSDNDEESEDVTTKATKKAAVLATKGKSKAGVDDEKQLRNEILELEKTFESLEMESGQKVANRPVGGLFRSSTIEKAPVQPLSYSHNSRPSRAPLRPQQSFNATVSRPLRFSWEETMAPPVVDKDSDEWNYKQTVIDGFDPAKFKQANKQGNFDSGIHIERQFGSAGSIPRGGGIATAKMTTIEMPGVPSYDRTEKQLIASLEQELGVL